MILYVDDCCIFYKDEETIDALLENPSKTFKLTNQVDVKSYIGKNFIIYANGTINIIQHAIIYKILNSLGICYESKMYDTPEIFILTRDEDGNGRKLEWHYSSVIGKMNYLSGTTRNDILFAVNEFETYIIYPKQSHEESFKMIGHY